MAEERGAESAQNNIPFRGGGYLMVSPRSRSFTHSIQHVVLLELPPAALASRHLRSTGIHSPRDRLVCTLIKAC